jgi:hypothetical protein
MAANPTDYNACLCYQAVNLGYCYGLCLDNTTLVDEFEGSVKSNSENACKVAELDPSDLPKTPVWQDHELTPIASSVSKTAGSSATSSPTETAGTSKGEDSGAVAVSVGSLVVVGGLVSLLF